MKTFVLSQKEKNKIQSVLNNLQGEIEEIKNPQEKEMSSYAFKNPFFNYKKRYQSDLEIISQIFKKGNILEIGSSPYHLTYCLKKLDYQIAGVDINPKILENFQKKHRLKISKADIQKDKLPFKDNQFHLIVFCEVFEHLGVNPLKTIRELHRMLKPQGILLLTTPNLYALHKSIRFMLGRSFNNPYDEFKKVETFGYMGHIREYSNREIKDILTKSGFAVDKTIFRKFDDFSKHPYLQFIPIKVLAFLLDFLMFLIPSFRPFQAVISTKKKEK